MNAYAMVGDRILEKPTAKTASASSAEVCGTEREMLHSNEDVFQVHPFAAHPFCCNKNIRK
jgi:hypothetical protein